jgi:peroxiredoxin
METHNLGTGAKPRAFQTFMLLAFTFALCGTGSAAFDDSRKAAPDFARDDANGAAVKLSNLRGRVVLLDFWATWCHGCKTEIPWYIEFFDKYKTRGLAVIGVSMDDGDWKVVKPFVAEKKINYPIVIGDDDLAKLYGVEEMPVTLLIDRDGKIAASHTGVVDKAEWEAKIQSLLNEPAKRAAH